MKTTRQSARRVASGMATVTTAVQNAVQPAISRVDVDLTIAPMPLKGVRWGIMSTLTLLAPSVGIVVVGPAVYAVRMIAQEKGISLVRPVGMGHSILM